MSRVKSAMFFLGLSFYYSLLVIGANAKAADYIEPCHIKDSADCYLAAGRKALPYLAAQADPLEMKDVDADKGDLLFKLKGLALTGLKNCQILKLERLDQFKAALVLECPVVVTGQYTLGGSLLGLPIDGNGDVKIQIEKLRLSITIEMKSYTGKDNELHYKIYKFNYEYDPITQVHYTFENLYGGDTTKAEPMNKILGDLDTGKEILRTYGKPVVEEVVTMVVGVVNNFFKENASKDLELP